MALFSINDLGQAVGRLGFRNRSPLAFLWDQGQAIVLDSGFSGGEALDINNNGIIVGRANGYHSALFDFGVLVSAFGSMPGDSNWNPEADLDGDNEVTLFDFGVLVRNFGAIGDD